MTVPAFQASWESPSNIALVKYWGKKENQLPMNPSLSMTLSKAVTLTIVKAFEGTRGPGGYEPEFIVNGEKDHPFTMKMKKLLYHFHKEFPVLKDFGIHVETSNTFPHSAGIASSASGLSAFALCMLDIACQAEGQHPGRDDFFRKASEYARLGSGSACRSVYGGMVLWGFTALVAGSSDEFAIPVNQFVHPSFTGLRDAILIVSSAEKPVSSTAGHSMMHTHPYLPGRIQQAALHLSELLDALRQGDFESVGRISEAEAMALHGLIMTSSGGEMLIRPGTLNIIDSVKKARRSGLPVFYTLDAGPNVHMIYPPDASGPVEALIRNELFPFCENEKVIFDLCGSGSRKPAED